MLSTPTLHQPTFSIGISFKNPGPSYFQLALDSVFAQTFSDWELILVDDGSNDGSVAVASAIVDPRVRFLCDGFNKNLNCRLNEMVSLARGRYFVRMDADDVMHPERLERQLEVLTREGENVVVGSAAFSIDNESKVIGIRPAPKPRRLLGFAARHSFTHPTVVATVQWFRENPYSQSFVFHRSQDAELWCRTSAYTRFIVMPETLLFYREIGKEFSLTNYLGTSLGVLYLVTVYGGSRLQSLYLFTRELCKIWFTCLCVRFGKDRWLIRRRFEKITEPERQRGERLLSFILDGTMRQCSPIPAASEVLAAASVHENFVNQT